MAKTITKLLAIFVAIALCACLSGCGAVVEDKTEVKETPVSMFVCVEKCDSWWIMYHRETKVMYAVSAGYYNCGTFTVMLNPDGTPMIWEGN